MIIVEPMWLTIQLPKSSTKSVQIAIAMLFVRLIALCFAKYMMYAIWARANRAICAKKIPSSPAKSPAAESSSAREISLWPLKKYVARLRNSTGAVLVISSISSLVSPICLRQKYIAVRIRKITIVAPLLNVLLQFIYKLLWCSARSHTLGVYITKNSLASV